MKKSLIDFYSLTEEEQESLTKKEMALYCGLTEEQIEAYFQEMEAKKIAEFLKSFRPLSKKQQDKLTIEELVKYKKQERKFLLETQAKIKGKYFRKLTYPFIYAMIPTLHLYTKIKVNAEGKVPKTNRPIIFSVSHIGYYDVEVTLQVIKRQVYLLSDDEETMYRTFDGWYFDRTGVIYIDNDDKEDVNVAFKTAIKYLNQGLNVYWCPEGTWNLTPNTLILPLHIGIVRAALETNALIVPISLDQKDKEKGANFDVKIGEAIDPRAIIKKESNFTLDDYKYLTNLLRDEMATLKYNCFEEVKREDYLTEYWQEFIRKRLAEWHDFYNLEIIKRRIYKPIDIVNEQDVFAHLNEIEIGPKNAFLARIKKQFNDDMDDINKYYKGIK